MSSWGDRQRLESEIKALFEEASSAGEELQARLARYACVLACGYIEASCREILSAFSAARAEGAIARYVQVRLGFFTGPRTEKMLQLVGEFDPSRKVQLEAAIDERLKDGINSICAHRNNIAHGRGSSISMGQLKSYFQCATEVIGKMRGLFPVRRASGG